MNKLKRILMLQALMLGALTLNAEDCPCEGGTAEYSVDCDGDGTNDACDTGDCPPCSDQNPDPETSGYECCGDEEYDPNADWNGSFTLASLDFTAILDAANDAMDTLPTQAGCSFDDPTVSGDITYQTKDDCCEDELTELRKFSGSVNVNMVAGCNIPIPFATIPKVAETFLVVNAGVGGSVSASTEETCGEDNACFTVDVGVSGGAGGMLEILAGIVQAIATLDLSGGVNGGYCTQGGFTGVDVCLSELSGTVETAVLWGLYDKSYNYVFDLGGC